MVDRGIGLGFVLAFTLTAALAAGCSVSNPPGYDALSAAEPLLVQATPWHPYGWAPLHWTLTDGRQVRVDVEHIAAGSGLGARYNDMAFDVAWDDGSGPALRCETAPAGPGVPETRFGCWSAADGGASVQFWMAPDAGCDADQANVSASLSSPSCWTGALATPADDYALEFGHFERTGSPVGRLSWLGSGGQVALAADVVAEAGMALYPGAGQALDDTLVLQTIALHWWWHASRSD